MERNNKKQEKDYGAYESHYRRIQQSISTSEACSQMGQFVLQSQETDPFLNKQLDNPYYRSGDPKVGCCLIS